jgi:hypothetical protein
MEIKKQKICVIFQLSLTLPSTEAFRTKAKTVKISYSQQQLNEAESHMNL